MTDHLGRNIKIVRTFLGYTQQEFATILKIKQPTLVRYEDGNTIPGGKVLQNLFKAIPIKPERFFALDVENADTACN